MACVRLAHYLGKLQNRQVARSRFRRLSGMLEPLVRVPAAAEIGGHSIPDVREVAWNFSLNASAQCWMLARNTG